MKTILYIVLLTILVSGLNSCQKEDLGEFNNKVSFLFFEQNASKIIQSMTFKLYPTGKTILPIIVKSMGKWQEEDVTFRLEIDTRLTTLPKSQYKLPKSCTFRKLRELDTCYIEVFNYPALSSQIDTLTLKIVETETIKEGALTNCRFMLEVSDMLIQPRWWKVMNGGYNGNYFYNIAERYYLGKYSEKKHSLFILELKKDGTEFDGSDLNILRKYALRLKYSIEAYNNAPENIGKPMWDDANDQAMTIPVAG
ncbi:MAG: DUF4843 domain-containing protein [Odoribacter sp.]